jgi:hypothetical protein
MLPNGSAFNQAFSARERKHSGSAADRSYIEDIVHASMDASAHFAARSSFQRSGTDLALSEMLRLPHAIAP